MKLGAKGYLGLFKTAAVDWIDDKAPRLGAALAFYTIFSLAPLMTIVVTIASLWYTENASHEVFTQMASVIGQDSAKGLEEMLMQRGEKKSGVFTAFSAGLMLLIGATGVFVQLQDSLNEIWEVKPKSGQGIMGFIRHRMLSFAMILGVAFLLLSSLLLSAGLAAVGKYFSHLMGDMNWLIQALNLVVSFGVITLLFALMFKYVPDARVAWKDVWFGAIITSVLFTIGKFGLGMYLGKSSVVSSYAAAGALLVVLLWVYYTSQIVFFGAELTQAYAYAVGRAVEPSAHAEWDAEKLCQAEAKENERNPQKDAKGKPESKLGSRSRNKPKTRSEPLPEPIYAMQSGGRARQAAKTFGGLLLLLVAFIPFEKKLRASKA